NEMMEQIAILRYQLWGFGLRVVRAKHRADVRLVREHAREPPQRVGVDTDVRVDEDDDLAASDLDTTVSRIGRTARAIRKTDDGFREFRRYQCRRVGTCIVDDDELPRSFRHLARAQRTE